MEVWQPKPGDRFYSSYFRSEATVVKYKDDDNWWFCLDNTTFVLKAQTTPDKLQWIRKD